MQKTKYIIIEGPRGVGKTTLARSIPVARYKKFPDPANKILEQIQRYNLNKREASRLFSNELTEFLRDTQNDKHQYLLDRCALTTGYALQGDDIKKWIRLHKKNIQMLKKSGVMCTLLTADDATIQKNIDNRGKEIKDSILHPIPSVYIQKILNITKHTGIYTKIHDVSVVK